MSTVDGLHVPVTPLSDVVGNAGTLAPAHIVSEVPKLKVGVMLGLTVTVNEIVAEHPSAENPVTV